jgi:hypothetical protein
MSNVSGSISVNVEFRDSTTSSGVQSLKTIALRDTTEYTTGKVAIITGTAGTAAVSLGGLSDLYRNASGDLVTVSDLSRIAFRWQGSSFGNTSRRLTEDGSNQFSLVSRLGETAVCSLAGQPFSLSLSAGGAGSTGTYTIVLYGT